MKKPALKLVFSWKTETGSSVGVDPATYRRSRIWRLYRRRESRNHLRGSELLLVQHLAQHGDRYRVLGAHLGCRGDRCDVHGRKSIPEVSVL